MSDEKNTYVGYKEYSIKYRDISEKVSYLKSFFQRDEKHAISKEIEKKSSDSNFWNDPKNAEKLLKKRKNIEDRISKYDSIISNLRDLNDYIEILKDSESNNKELSDELNVEENSEVSSEIESLIKNLEKTVDYLYNLELIGDVEDQNVIITIHSGAGGTEACDWSEMLYRMYVKWASSNGYTIKELDSQAGDSAGYKSVTFKVEGYYASAMLESESGVHRLVRISPFDSSSRRHTSFSAVEVLPEITDDITVEIDENDLRIDTYRASGAGGQHVNKTDSAVRIVHKPTNIVVTCQSERSQTKNKETAMKILKSKLYELKKKQQKEKIEELKSDDKEIGWGSQIRSYVFHPYSMVKDHRTSFETGNVNGVMNGDISEFINQYLIYKKKIDKTGNKI